MISGPKAPRSGNIYSQYFAHLLSVDGEDARITYVENIYEEQAINELTLSYAVDAEIGTAFFDDPTRMFRDLLADGAREVLGRERSETVCAAR